MFLNWLEVMPPAALFSILIIGVLVFSIVTMLELRYRRAQRQNLREGEEGNQLIENTNRDEHSVM